MLFDSWYDLLRIVVVGFFGYCGLVLLLRVTGKRTLSKMNAFDFVVTVALGSTLATVLLSADVTLTEGLLAFTLLCGLQYVVAFWSVRSESFQSLIKAEPTLMFHHGRFLDAVLRRERVTREEVGLPQSGGPVAVLVHDGLGCHGGDGRRSGSGWRSRPVYDLWSRGPIAQR